MARILLFGGAFSPPTLAHEAIMAACLGMSDFDEVWAMPSGDRIDKTIALDDKNRLRILEAVKTEQFGGDPRLIISDFELQLPRPTQTIDTLAALHKSFPDTDFWFAFGRDSYLSMPSWPDGRELQKNLKMVVFCSGPGVAIKADDVIVADLGSEYSDVSSTKVRTRLRNHQTIDGLVSGPVARYLSGL